MNFIFDKIDILKSKKLVIYLHLIDIDTALVEKLGHVNLGNVDSGNIFLTI